MGGTIKSEEIGTMVLGINLSTTRKSARLCCVIFNMIDSEQRDLIMKGLLTSQNILQMEIG